MLPLAAYADRLSVRPGETIRFHVANATGQATSARLVRVICADANPAGPGIQLESMGAAPTLLREPGPEPVPRGSCGRVDGIGARLARGSLTFACRVMPTLAVERQQTIAALGDTDNGFELFLDADGALAAEVRANGTAAGVSLNAALPLRHWHLVTLRVDTENAALTVALHPLGRDALARKPASATTALDVSPDWAGAPTLLLATAPGDHPTAHFNGKLERPAIWGRVLDDAAVAALADDTALTGPGDALACWDLARDVASARIVDVAGSGLHGTLVNTPARAMTGSTWTGREMNFAHAPDQYGAIHFHEDDLSDCNWPVAYEWQVPDGTRSAVYALMLSGGDAEENVPFHVVPPRGRATADIAVLASTYTYTIYANHSRLEFDTNPDWRERWHAQTRAWGAYPHNPGDHKEYGLSTYNNHPDGAGISIASWHRPMLNVRVGYLTYCDEAIRGSGLRHFPADSHLNCWLEQQGLAYDVITDRELHEEGAELLGRYRTVVTGSHPEYHSRQMIDALRDYRDTGGRLVYLGGNGFYWKIAVSPERDGVIEIRRGEGGIRAWAADPGEYYNQLDGEYGGLWRRNGRPPQHLTGVGFTAQGNFHGSYYRRAAGADDPRAAWIFDGVDADIIGDHGLSAHGAAGFELDRTDKRLGTPDHAIVVASSENHPPDAPWVLVPEEVLTHLSTWSGEKPEDLIRADMTFFETPGGGAVFSTGSITFCGSLLTNDGNNEVSRIIANVLRRFTDPTPFDMP